jgi:hypothetical protein
MAPIKSILRENLSSRNAQPIETIPDKIRKSE